MEIYESKSSSLFETHLKSLVNCRASSVHFLMKIHGISYLNEVPNPSTLLSANTYNSIAEGQIIETVLSLYVSRENMRKRT